MRCLITRYPLHRGAKAPVAGTMGLANLRVTTTWPAATVPPCTRRRLRQFGNTDMQGSSFPGEFGGSRLFAIVLTKLSSSASIAHFGNR